jgi:diphosphomevalonate decarboxylase
MTSVIEKSEILVTCDSAPNIALIKYWGKSNEDLNLPLNGSVSISLDKQVMNSKTSLMLVKRDEMQRQEAKIEIWLNNQKQEFHFDVSKQIITQENTDLSTKLINKKRFLRMLKKIISNCSIDSPASYDLIICSRNNFPTACGLASSASGYACIAQCLANAYKYNGNVTELARLGSGSACRSCNGGFVKWFSSDKSEESIAQVLFPSTHWPEMNVLILVLEDERKKIPSTDGMQQSVMTSDLLKSRIKLVEDGRLDKMEEAIKEKDFSKFAKLTMRDSNNFHSICMDTYPPLFYLNEKSKDIINFIHRFNAFTSSENISENLKAAYSFDAGPNAFLFVQDEYLADLIYFIHKCFVSSTSDLSDFVKNKLILNESKQASLRETLINYDKDQSKWKEFEANLFESSKSIIKYMIHSKVGEGPTITINDYEFSQLNNFGLPK